MGLTKIEWTDFVFNPWWGCTRVSAGCEHCYAETFAKRTGKAQWGPKAARRLFGVAHWREPIKWNAKARSDDVRRRVFCASMADVFEHDDSRILNAARQRLWTLIESTDRLDWLLLTKRPENVERMLPPAWLESPRPNVWIGTSIEDQKTADARLPLLLEAPAAIRFVSYEPALDKVSWWPWLTDMTGVGVYTDDHGKRHVSGPVNKEKGGIDWVIVGGESGPGARPFNVAWARSTVKECRAAGIACFVKQITDRGRKQPFETWPSDLKVREYPDAR